MVERDRSTKIERGAKRLQQITRICRYDWQARMLANSSRRTRARRRKRTEPTSALKMIEDTREIDDNSMTSDTHLQAPISTDN